MNLKKQISAQTLNLFSLLRAQKICFPLTELLHSSTLYLPLRQGQLGEISQP
jgi:hypothetical protein